MSHLRKMWIADETSGDTASVNNNALDVNIQDQTTEPIDDYFLRELGSFTLAADTTASTATTLQYTFTATTGHGLAADDEILLLDAVADRSFYSVVTNVATDTITVDRPIDHVFPSATALAKTVTNNMAVDGSTTPLIYTLRAGTTPIDICRFLLTILGGSAAMDDGKFGNITALSNGLVFRIVDGFQKTVFNFKSNQNIKQFCYDVAYSDNAPAGNTGLSARISFNGPSKHGVALRVSGDTALQWIVQDDLTGLDVVRVAGEGHKTSGEI